MALTIIPGPTFVFAVLSFFLAYDIVSGSQSNYSDTIGVPEPGFSKDTPALVYVTESMGRQQAEYVCSHGYHGHLVKFDLKEEELPINSFMDSDKVPHHFWIGLQWNMDDEGQRFIVWNDGNCTRVNSRDNFKKDHDKEFRDNYQCFVSHLTSPDHLFWESKSCKTPRQAMCDGLTHSWEEKNIAFYVILQPTADAQSCKNLCYDLRDCFMTSPIPSACIVGVTSYGQNTFVIGEGKNLVTDDARVDYTNITVQEPSSCRQDDNKTREVTHLSDYVLLNGTWNASDVSPCPKPVTVTRHIYVTKTLTASSFDQTVLTTSASDAFSSLITPSQSSELQASSSIRQVPEPFQTSKLLLDKSKLSKTIRAKTSASNKKQSSKALGYSMALPFFFLFIALLVVDVYTHLFDDLRQRFWPNVRHWTTNGFNSA